MRTTSASSEIAANEQISLEKHILHSLMRDIMGGSLTISILSHRCESSSLKSPSSTIYPESTKPLLDSSIFFEFSCYHLASSLRPRIRLSNSSFYCFKYSKPSRTGFSIMYRRMLSGLAFLKRSEISRE